MTQHLKREIDALRSRLATLGRNVTLQIDDALQALLTSDPARASEVMDADREIDAEEVAIEEECLKVIALHQPVTGDLRFLATALKIDNDLERIGDHAVNIAYAAREFAKRDFTNFPPQIVKMGRLVTEACHNCIDAFLDEDIDIALTICHDDKAINELCGLVYDEAKRFVNEGQWTYGQAIRIYRVGRELERVGDLLKNIAEDTIYLVTGEVVRHNRLRLLELDSSRSAE